MRKKILVIFAMITIWTIVIAYSTAIVSAASCPYGRRNCPGRCGRFTDSNGDGICDLSQTITKTQAPATQKPVATPKPTIKVEPTIAATEKPTQTPQITNNKETAAVQKTESSNNIDNNENTNKSESNSPENKETKTVATSKTEENEPIDFKVANSIMFISVISWSIYGLCRFIANSSAKP